MLLEKLFNSFCPSFPLSVKGVRNIITAWSCWINKWETICNYLEQWIVHNKRSINDIFYYSPKSSLKTKTLAKIPMKTERWFYHQIRSSDVIVHRLRFTTFEENQATECTSCTIKSYVCSTNLVIGCYEICLQMEANQCLNQWIQQSDFWVSILVFENKIG